MTRAVASTLLFGLLLGVAHAAGPAATAWDEPLPASLDSRAQQLLSCYGMDPTDEPLQFGEYISGKRTSRLHVLSMLWSAKKGGNADSMLSVATVVTIDRMENLRAQCLAWPGPLTVALYQALTPEEWEQVKAAKAQQGKEGAAGRAGGGTGRTLHYNSKRARSRLDRLFSAAQELFRWAEMHGDAACSLRMLLAVEPMQDEVLMDLMPINALRNLALLAADTPLALMLDVDLIPSASLNQLFLGGKQAKGRQLAASGDSQMTGALGRHERQLAKSSSKPGPAVGTPALSTAEDVRKACENKALVVLPAFERLEPNGTSLEVAIQRTDAVARGTKANLISQFKAGQVISFHGRDFAPSEAATRYELWTASNTSYAITWEVMYEPYFIVDRLQMGKIPYDVRFRSGAHNKQEQVAQAALSGFTLLAHPHAWVVHRPHPPSPYLNLLTVARSSARAMYNKAPAPPSRFNYSSSLVEDANRFRLLSKEWYMALIKQKGRSAPVVEEPFRQCLQLLGWWTGGQ